jgi:hypothetical protein
MSDKLAIKNEMAQFDRKNRNFYDELTDEEKKKFSTFLMIRYGASVSGNSDLQAYYLMATNERLNKNFFDLGKHSKLQWLCATTVSPDMGNQFHYCLAAKKKTTDNKLTKFLTKLYPNAKDDEIALLAQITDKKDLKAMAKEMGMEDKDIKKELD